MAKVKSKDGTVVRLMYDGQIYTFMAEPEEVSDYVADFFCAKYTNVEKVTCEDSIVTEIVKHDEPEITESVIEVESETTEIPIVLSGDVDHSTPKRGRRGRN